MSVSHKRIRMRVLAIATATALSSVAVPALAAERLNLGGLQSADLHDRFIVKYRDGTAASSDSAALQRQLQTAARAVPASKGAPLAVRALRRTGTGAEVVTTGRKLDRAEAEMLMRQIAADPAVEYVEVDQVLQIALSPNDPRYSQQWGYFNATGGIRADQAWDVSTGAGIVVAVLDTGSTSHSDLNGNTIAGYDMVSDATVGGDGNARDADPSDPGDYYGSDPSSWHGTHVAGTVGGSTYGVAKGVTIHPVRVLGCTGSGSNSGVIAGVDWVAANRVLPAVANMSLGGAASEALDVAVNNAIAQGVSFVVAAGEMVRWAAIPPGVPRMSR